MFFNTASSSGANTLRAAWARHEIYRLKTKAGCAIGHMPKNWCAKWSTTSDVRGLLAGEEGSAASPGPGPEGDDEDGAAPKPDPEGGEEGSEAPAAAAAAIAGRAETANTQRTWV